MVEYKMLRIWFLFVNRRLILQRNDHMFTAIVTVILFYFLYTLCNGIVLSFYE